MPHRTDIQVRFSDTDAQGHVNNTAYAVFAELARADLLDALRGSETHLLLAEMTLHFKGQVRFGQAVHVMTEVQEVGESSVTLKQTVYADGEEAATIASVVVLFDPKAQAPKAFTAAVRAHLEAGEPLG